MKLYSLRRATLTAVIVPLMLGTAAIGLSAVWFTDRAIGTLRDDHMVQDAAFLLALGKHEHDEGDLSATVRGLDWQSLHGRVATATGFRVWLGDTMVAQSGTNPLPGDTLPALGFSFSQLDGVRWRSYAAHDPSVPLTIEINEPVALRTETVSGIVLSVVLPLVFLIAAVCALAWVQVARLLRPLRAIARSIDSRAPSDFSPLPGYRVPYELAPLFVAFDGLLARLRAALERERAFADNAAHELRTPLAALKTRAQLVSRALAGDPARQQTARALVEAVDRATGVINHLLLINRLQASEPRSERTDMSRLVEQVARELAPAALQKDQRIGVDIAPGLAVPGHPDAIAMAVRNGIDNAIRYTQAGGTIAVALRRDAAGRVLLRIVDDGPGIPEADLERATQRFVRLNDEQPGSGLGLSIVRQVAAQHGGTLRLSNRRPHGLTLELSLPYAAAASPRGALPVARVPDRDPA